MFIAPLTILLIRALFLPATHGTCISMEHLRNVVQVSSCCVRISCVERKPESLDLSAKNKHRGALRLAGRDALDATEAPINTQGATSTKCHAFGCICAAVLLRCF